jgi:hypothetical protein
MDAVQVKISEWAFRRVEAGQRAMVMPEAYLVQFPAGAVGCVFSFIEFGYEGKGVDSPVLTGRKIDLGVSNVTVKQPGMAAGYVLVEFIDIN